MNEFTVYSHLVPLVIQASLVNLVWTDRDYLQKPVIRWTRMTLLPITLGLVFSNLVRLKYQVQMVPYTKLNLGSMFASQALKSVLFTFNQPPSLSSTKTKDTSTPHPPALTSALPNVVSLMFCSSSDPSKGLSFGSGFNHNIQSDVMFLFRTFRRLLFHHCSGVIALICWKSVNDAALRDQLGSVVETYKPEITAFCCGILASMFIDLSGCLLRILMFTIKVISIFFSALLSSAFQDWTLLRKLGQVDLEETFPFSFPKTPLKASSITDFWSRHWHSMII